MSGADIVYIMKIYSNKVNLKKSDGNKAYICVEKKIIRGAISLHTKFLKVILTNSSFDKNASPEENVKKLINCADKHKL